MKDARDAAKDPRNGPAGEIARLFEELNEDLEALEKSTEGLRARIAPVVVQMEGECPAPGAIHRDRPERPRLSSTEISRQIENIRDRVRGLTFTIDKTANHVAL